MKSLRTLAAFVFALPVSAVLVKADWVVVDLPYDKFGHLGNQGSSCASTATANSFTFLENQYPNVYDHLLRGTGGTADIRDRLRDGWTAPDGTVRPGMGCGPSPDVWWRTKRQYLQDFAPGRTVFAGQYAASYFAQFGPPFDNVNWGNGEVANTPPTWDFLLKELQDGEDVEFAFQGKDQNGNNVDHALTLTSLHFQDGVGGPLNGKWDPGEARKVDFIDPNNPTNGGANNPIVGDLFSQTLQAGTPPRNFDFLCFKWDNGGANTPVNSACMYLAFSESPNPAFVPLPAAAWMGLALLTGVVVRKAIRSRRA